MGQAQDNVTLGRVNRGLTGDSGGRNLPAYERGEAGAEVGEYMEGEGKKESGSKKGKPSGYNFAEFCKDEFS